VKYRVEAHRERGWWALEFPDVDERIHSQVRRLEQAPEVAAEALTFWFEDSDGRTVTADDIEVVPMLEGCAAVELTTALEVRGEASVINLQASRATRNFVMHCVAEGLSYRDIASLLGVSHQYVAKVTKQDELV
jgi:DNA-directed RNA polymerase specialized sigma24 family protein